MARFDLHAGVDAAIALDVHDHIDWQVVDELTQQRYGDKATWWAQATPGVNYYRANMPAKHLPGRVLRMNETDINPYSLKMRRQVGAAVWMFPGDDVRALLMAEQHLQGIPVWVEVDDNYTAAPPLLSSWASTRKQAAKTGQHSYETHRKIVQSKAVTGVIVSTPKLAEVYGRLHANVVVCPNSVDPADWPTEEPPHQLDDVLRVGWAGSASHGYDLADIQRALDWASRQKNVEVVLFGQLTMPIRHRNIPWTDSLAEYRQNVSQIDVMLCPLRPSVWADCKSDVKALEGVMGGAVPVVSRTEPFRSWWEEEKPCYVADSPKGFLKVVKHLVAHRDEVRETARLAREYVLIERTIAANIVKWREALA